MNVDEQTLEALLRTYFAPDTSHDDADLERLALGLLDDASPEARAEAEALLRGDPELREVVTIVGEAPEPATILRPRRFVGAVAIGLAMAAAGLLAVFVNTPGVGSPPRMLLKGTGDHFSVGLHRGGRSRPVAPLDVVEPNDELGFFYSARAPGYLVVAHLDERGQVQVLDPARSEGARAIQPGQDRPLPDGAIAEVGSGCEWFVAAFFDHAVPVSALSEALRVASPGAECELSVQVPQARTLEVVSVRRSP